MQFGRGLAICFLLVIAGCGGGGTIAPPSAGSGTVPTASPVASTPYDAIVGQSYGGGWGVALGIFRHGTPVYVHGYGFRDRGKPDSFYGSNFWGIPQLDALLNLPRGAFAPDADTEYNLASVSKEFTAAAILLLEQDGKLSTQDRLSKYFPALPGASMMTLQNLLHHSSGFVDYNNFGVYPDFTASYDAFMASNQTDYGAIVNALAGFPLNFPPGTAYEYSNTNYALLGMIVASVSGESLGAFLNQRIFAPLHMTHTQQGYPPSSITDVALGYVDRGAGARRAYQWNLDWLAGPGGMMSSINDLEKWDRAVRASGIFTSQTLAEMFAPSAFPQPYGAYADGWFVSTLSGHRYIWHDGAIGGFQTMNATFPDDDLDIIILTNDGSGPDPYYIVPALFAAVPPS